MRACLRRLRPRRQRTSRDTVHGCERNPNGTDPLLLHPPIGLEIQTFISAFVFGPFYLLLVYAFSTGRDWIRMPAILYVSAMTYGMRRPHPFSVPILHGVATQARAAVA